jgi:preprotein translocase SecE subunit
VANKMAAKKKNASQSQSQTAEQKARDGEQEQGKSTKAEARARVERKGSESKTAARPRETNRSGSKGPSETLTRLRSNRIVRFLFESYYELRYKVTWPTAVEARNMTFVVIALSVAVGLILGLADLALSQLYLLILHWAGV